MGTLSLFLEGWLFSLAGIFIIKRNLVSFTLCEERARSLSSWSHKITALLLNKCSQKVSSPQQQLLTAPLLTLHFLLMQTQPINHISKRNCNYFHSSPCLAAWWHRELMDRHCCPPAKFSFCCCHVGHFLSVFLFLTQAKDYNSVVCFS